MKIGCAHPGCTDSADSLAYDEMFSLNIGFCDAHVAEWLAKDHITEAGA